VLPDAGLKIYLEASAEARARRRFLEVQAKGESTDYEAILRSMRARDAYDSTRSIAPLKPADDAVVLDTTDLSIDETYERTLALVRAAAQT
jgi:cytidylate kinase